MSSSLHHRVSVFFSLLAAVAGGACGGDDGVNGSAGGGTGGGGVGGAGGSFVEPPNCADDIVWAAAGALADGRDHHATFGFEANGKGYLYASGGWNYDAVFKDVRVAVIGTDPLAVSWSSAGELPIQRAGHAVAQLDGHVFLVGGQRPGAFMDDVTVAALQPDGSLSPWNGQAPLPERRFHLAMVAAKGQLIVTGGLQQSDFSATDTVYIGRPEDGVISDWQTSILPSPRSHHASFVAGDYLYITGGLEGSPANNPTELMDVWRAPLLDEGGLGAWEQLPDLPSDRVTHAAFVRGRCAYLTGGLVKPLTYSSEVLAASFDEQGNLGEWRVLPSALPVGRSHMHHVAILHDRAYLLGGSTSYQKVTGESAVGEFIHGSR